MTQEEYEQKKQECWEEYKRTNLDGEVQWQPVSRYDVFCAAFDRAYALGQEKQTITQEEIEEAAEDYVSFEKGGKCYPNNIVERVCCCAFKDGVKFALGKQEKEAEDTVIQGWVGRDQDGYISLFQERPTRDTCDKGDIPYGFWGDDTEHYIELPITSFPDLTWESDPKPVEIIIKRKKK